jgi:methionyl aminopeptidase
MIVRKSKIEFEKMRRAGQIVADVHKEVRDLVKPGVSTLELDRAAEARIRKAGAIPTFKGYPAGKTTPFPATLCVSINEEVVHGIPSANRVLQEGDIISIDCGATFDGYVGDSACTWVVGKTSDPIRLLVDRTRESLYKGIAMCFPDNRVGDIGHAVETFAKSFGYGVVEDYCGHGVGRRLHEEPQVPNVGIPGTGKRLKSGWAIAIEPMLNLGTKDTIELEDEWTVITADRQHSAHWEHTIAITDEGPFILTSRGDDPPGPWRSGTQPMV